MLISQVLELQKRNPGTVYECSRQFGKMNAILKGLAKNGGMLAGPADPDNPLMGQHQPAPSIPFYDLRYGDGVILRQ